MKKSIKLWMLLTLMGGVMLLSGCPRINMAKPQASRSAIDWVQAHSGPFTVDYDRLFYGIGRAAGSTNATLLRATADNQARAEMDRVLSGYFNRLIDATGWQGDIDEKQQMIYGLTQTTLQRARITDHRFNEADQTLSSLCSLPLTAVEDALRSAPYIGNTLKREMLGRAEDVHQQNAVAP